MSSLAKRFGVTQESILTLNGLTNPNWLTVGQKLKIPGQGQDVTVGDEQRNEHRRHNHLHGQGR